MKLIQNLSQVFYSCLKGIAEEIASPWEDCTEDRLNDSKLQRPDTRQAGNVDEIKQLATPSKNRQLFEPRNTSLNQLKIQKAILN